MLYAAPETDGYEALEVCGGAGSVPRRWSARLELRRAMLQAQEAPPLPWRTDRPRMRRWRKYAGGAAVCFRRRWQATQLGERSDAPERRAALLCAAEADG